MKKSLFRGSLVAGFLCCGFCFPLKVSAQRDAASDMRAGHKAIVESWLKLRTDLRLATEADNTNKEGLAATRADRGRNYQPYYVVGDFNGDWKEDFAVAFVKKKKSQWPFVFAIFNYHPRRAARVGTPDGPTVRATRPTFSVDADLTDGGIFYNPQNPPSQFRLAFGAFQTDNCVIVSPRRQSYATRPCLE